MSDRLVFTILGCGSSGGVPRIGNYWGACDPNEPRNRRRRCSLLVERIAASGDKTTVVIDTTPDMRMQLLDAGIERVDGVLYTHPHADHIHGIDDLRVLAISQRQRVDVYADDATSARLHQAFDYCFTTPPGSNYPPILTEHRIAAGEPVTIDGAGGPVTALPVRQLHGEIDALGFRIEGVGYSSDIIGLPDESLEAFSGLDVWIVDALRRTPHPSHFSFDDALDWIERMKPKRAILTNMHVDMDYRTLCDTLPAEVEPGFDGLSFEFLIAA
ncbi:MAG: MBL fold metallo-hydrolase [Hyphomicrobiales bacterium]|nr:MBL fold metallo-hydrolase [Hyphomicrobiales bacterium]